MPKTSRSKALVPARKPGALTAADRQKKSRALTSEGKMLVQGLILDESDIFCALLDKFWIEREDGDDPRKFVAGIARFIDYVIECDEYGNYFRMPNAPDAALRVTTRKIKKC